MGQLYVIFLVSIANNAVGDAGRRGGNARVGRYAPDAAADDATDDGDDTGMAGRDAVRYAGGMQGSPGEGGTRSIVPLLIF